MIKEEAKIIYESMVYAFAGSPEQGQAIQWRDYLLEQDFGISKKVADWFRLHSGKTFMPSLAEFHAKVKAQQMENSRRELMRTDVAACSECHGLTWLEEPTGKLPCPQCRPTSFARWEAKDYFPGVPPNIDEIDGPKQNYQIAAEPRIFSGPQVSVERAKQWMLHLLSPSESIYPEGDIIEVTDEPKDILNDF